MSQKMKDAHREGTQQRTEKGQDSSKREVDGNGSHIVVETLVQTVCHPLFVCTLLDYLFKRLGIHKIGAGGFHF